MTNTNNTNSDMVNYVQDTTEAPRPQVIVGYDADGNVVKVERLDATTVQDVDYSEDKEGN